MAKRKNAVQPPTGTKKARSAKPVKQVKPVEPDSESEDNSFAEFSEDNEDGAEEVALDESADDLDDSDDRGDEQVNGDSEDDSEDELDESDDELDAGSDAEDAENAEGDEGSPENALSAAEKAAKRKEQKQMRQERKLGKAMGQEIHDIKKVWEKLRQKTMPAAERKKLEQQAFDLAKDQIKDLVFKHDSSRVVQTIFKYADQEKRVFITNALKGSYVPLARSSYGKYLLVKMLHYGSAATRQQILDELHGNFRKLMKHREGAYVIEDAFRDYSTAAQRRQILREFYGSEFAIFKDAGEAKANLAEIIAANPDKRPYLLENLNEVLTSAVNKGSIGFEIIHAAMLEYMRNVSKDGADRETFVDLVSEQIVEMVHTNDGSQAASLVFALSNAKERKKLVKALREFSDKLMTDQYGNLVLMAIFSTVDDTVLVSKAFGPAIEDTILTLAKDKFGRRPLLYLLAGRTTKYFAKDVQDRFVEVDKFKEGFSKKDDEARRQELVKAFSPVFYEALANHTAELVSDPLSMQFVGETLLNADKEAENREAALDAVVNAFAGSPRENPQHPLVKNAMASRTLKQLVKEVPEFAERLLPLVEAHAADWALGEGTFVVVALIETLGDKAKALKKKVQKTKAAIEKTQPKGGKILLGLL